MTGERALLEPGGHVLVVDDQPDNLDLLEELLSSAGYRVTRAKGGEEALGLVAREIPDTVVLDVMMPRLDGFEVCRRLKSDARTRLIPVVMLTALTDVSSKVRGLEAGADDFLNKPVQKDELLTRVRALVRIQRLRRELDSADEIILTLVQALESREAHEIGHAERVAAAALATAVGLDLPALQLEAVARGGMLHDIGKLGLALDLLAVSDPHAPPADSPYRRHAELGAQALQPLRSLRACLDVVRHHHERLDGSGYPSGLSGDAFRPAIEVVALSNLYDDLRHDLRLEPEAAAARLRAEAASGRFRAETVERFLGVGVAALSSGTREAVSPWHDLRTTPAAHRTGRVLVCDDTAANRELLAEILAQDGHQVHMVEDGESVLPAILEHDPDLVVLDIRLPDLDGFTICDWIKRSPETRLLPVLMVTAQAEERHRVRRAQVEADDILQLPVNRLEFLARVRSLLRLKVYHRDLEDQQSVLMSLATLLEAKDPHYQGHSTRVGDIGAQLGRELGLSDEQCEGLRVAGLLHDIGSLSVPERLLNQPGPLDEVQRATVRTHPELGADLCASLKTVRGVLPLVRHHHERFDGSGYPDGLRGEQIPIGARVLGLADSYDALTSDRPHRPHLDALHALDLLARETSDGLWDPSVLQALRALVQVGA